jgi:carbonic anhydrase
MIKQNSRTFLTFLFKTVFLIPFTFSLVNCSNVPTKETQAAHTTSSEPTKETQAGHTTSSEPTKDAQAGHTTSSEPTKYYNLPARDPGVTQSPINIFTLDSKTETGKHQFIVNFSDAVSAVKNLGHTVQLALKPGSSVNYNGTTYYFRQLHFHTPAEHQIDGVTYPMEMHIVCSTDTPKTPSYVVLTVLFKMGRSNEFISDILSDVPREHNATYSGFNHIKLGHFLNLNDSDDAGSHKHATDDSHHHYHYSGSLTTAPYTETVNWIIYKHIFEASPDEIMAINKLEGNNARHIQPVNNRIVEND